MLGAMAEVAVAGDHHRHTASISTMDNAALLRTSPRIEMMPNPDFSFPALPQTLRTSALQLPASEMKRPVSAHSKVRPETQPSLSHRRNVTAHALPSFTFSAVSGLQKTSTPPLTPDGEGVPITPKRGHRRDNSQLVGGDVRALKSIISSGPTESSMSLLAPPYGPPPGRRGHGHRRSDGISVSCAATGSESPRISRSLPTTPLDHPSVPTQAPILDRTQSAPIVNPEPAESFRGPCDVTAPRPASRTGPRITFSDDVEIIPRSRPLSTISSETGSSISTVRGLTAHNSMNSLLSLSVKTPSPQRTMLTSLSAPLEDERRPRARSSLEISKAIEKEGEWLRSPRSSQSLKRLPSKMLAEVPISPSTAPPAQALSSAEPEVPNRPRHTHQRMPSIFGGRRRSLPILSSKAYELTRPSSSDNLPRAQTSSGADLSQPMQRRSSTMKICDWAASKMSKRSRDMKALSADAAEVLARPQSAGDEPVPGKVPILGRPVAETDLDAVFGSQSLPAKSRGVSAPSHPCIEFSTPTPSYVSSFHSSSCSDDTSAILDLDAALGPFNSPSLSGFKPRRELHSSRLNRDFSGPGLHYHRRAESAPELPPFSRGSMVSHTSLPDVFEGEGEEEAEAIQPARPVSSWSEQEDEGGIGIQVVDADVTGVGPGFAWAAEDGLRTQSGKWGPKRPSTPYGIIPSRLSTHSNERQPCSNTHQTKLEESSPVEAVEIVESHEEPRTSSLTRSSDSSQKPTLLVPQPEPLTVADGSQSLMTPETYQTSTFSSPDFSGRQGSFDTPRIGTAASSITGTRTISSCTGDPCHGVRKSSDDVPSLTSSRSTMISTVQPNVSRRDIGSTDLVSLIGPGTMDPALVAERRRKRTSIQSLSQLMGGSVSDKSKGSDDSRPQTAVDSLNPKAPKKEHRLKKLMFWRSKSRQSLQSLT